MAYGDGTIQQNENKTWTMRVVIGGRRYKRTGATKTAGRAKISQLRTDIATGEAEAEEKTAEDIVTALLDSVPVP